MSGSPHDGCQAVEKMEGGRSGHIQCPGWWLSVAWTPEPLWGVIRRLSGGLGYVQIYMKASMQDWKVQEVSFPRLVRTRIESFLTPQFS